MFEAQANTLAGQRDDYKSEARTRFWTTGNNPVNMTVGWQEKKLLSSFG
jgi:hypothetical protein